MKSSVFIFCSVFYPICFLTACTHQSVKSQHVPTVIPNDHSNYNHSNHKHAEKNLANHPNKQLSYRQSNNDLVHSHSVQNPVLMNQKQIPDTYRIWLNNSANQQQAIEYTSFLESKGLAGYIPDHEFFQSARDWKKCGAAEFEIPPTEIWSNIIPTLQIMKVLVDDKVISDFTVTSVYRNFSLNRCAKGADTSRHVFNTAIDFRIGSERPDTLETIQIVDTKKRLCTFWQDKGAALNMGLGVYSSGQIHIDSAGYRTWGPDHRSKSSPCLSGSI
ncbi:D-Ala-D-Ala carboxypeptidase family metallohydrolase [Psychrobacter sp. AOP7-B1-24]|uniref:D-Ala-D-Ala carboxypeptidase family metallohydrolase n=1 Tax=Psychrobacter sp. AOP7-B1-24 TaxID=3457645 RepID=UPI00402BA5E4